MMAWPTPRRHTAGGGTPVPSFQGWRDLIGLGPVPAAPCDPERVADGNVDPSDLQAPTPDWAPVPREGQGRKLLLSY